MSKQIKSEHVGPLEELARSNCRLSSLATRCGEMANELRLLKLALERGDANPKVVADVAALLRLLAADLEQMK